jgi:site-specific DNA-methyltransferase (adenine-specific)
MDEVLSFKQMVVWDKGKMGMGWHYRRSYETVLVAQKGKGKTAWYDDSHRIENVIRPGDYGIRKVIPGKGDHPTPKPVALAEHFIGLHTKPGDTVLDPFMGRGWVGLACLKLGRNFIGCEIDPEHYGFAERRIEAALKATREPLVAS